MAAGSVRKFTFDTVFDSSGRILRDADGPCASYTVEEVEAAKQAAFAEGERSAVAVTQEQIAQALNAIAAAASEMLARLSAESASLKQDAAALGVVAAKAAAGRALTCFGEEEVDSFFAEAADLLRAAPRVIIRVAPDAAQAAEARLTEAARQAGLEGQLIVSADENAGPGDIAIEWPDGAVERSTQHALQRIEEAAQRWLSAHEAETDDQLELFAA